MSARILVPIDGSEESRLALLRAVAQFPGEQIVLLHVIEPFPDHTKAGGRSGQRRAQVFKNGQQLLDATADLGDQYAGTITTELVYGRPVHVIPRFVESNGIDEVVIGSRGRDGTARLLLGSVAETVVRRVPVPVTVVRSTGEDDESRAVPPEHVLVPFDQSVCSRRALEYAFEQFPAATVTALFVTYPKIEAYEQIESGDDLGNVIPGSAAAEQDTDTVFEMAKQIGERHERRIETATEAGEPSREILDWINENDIDHVVIGCHGRDGVARWLLGSVAETIVRRAPTSVTTVK